MEPTIDTGDRVLINRYAYSSFTPWDSAASPRSPSRGDVVVFRATEDLDPERSLFLKRVVAIEGDTVQFRAGRLWLNGTPVPVIGRGTRPVEHLGRAHRLVDGPSWAETDEPYVVPKGYMFVVGDNRANSHDSRAWGAVPVRQVRGKVFWVFNTTRRHLGLAERLL